MATKRVEIQVAKAAEVPTPLARQVESMEPVPTPQPPQAEPKPQPVLMESPPKREEGECGRAARWELGAFSSSSDGFWG